MVISKTRFNRLPVKPTSVSRRLNPTKMKCNPGNFQCGASCKPIRNKRTGKDTNCKANVPLGMARTGLLWLKDREERVAKLNEIRQQRRSSGKSRKSDLALNNQTGRLNRSPIPAPSPQSAPWENFLAGKRYSQAEFNALPARQRERLKRAFAREEKEVLLAIAKQQREEARNAAIREEVKTMESVKIPNHFKVQKETPKGDGTSDYLIEARHSVINGKPNKYGSLIYSINASSGENAQQIFKRAIANAEKENSVIDPEDTVKTTPSKLTNQITAIPVDTASNRKPRSAAPRKSSSIVEQPTRAAIQAPKPKPKSKQGVADRQYTGKATSKQDTLASIIVGEMFNASGNDANNSVSIWLSKMEGYNPQAAKAIEAVANAVSDADPRWILDNQDLLTVPAFKKNYPAIGKALGVDIAKSEAIEQAIGEASPKRKGTPAQLPWAESIMDKLLDPFNRSGLASTQNWLRQLKADGDTKRVGQIEEVLKIIDKKDAGWIINNEKRLTPKAFRDNHEMYAVQFGIIPPLPALPKLTFDQLTREIKRLRQPGAGNSQRLGWAEQELKRRSDSDSFAERLRKYKKSRHKGRG